MELIQAVKKTVHPDGKVQVYTNGMMPKKRSAKGINYWFLWLRIVTDKIN